MSPVGRTSVLFLVLIANLAATISCSVTRLRSPHKINRYNGNDDTEMIGIGQLRGNISSTMYTEPTEQQWENLCKEANYEYYEWCRRTSDVILGNRQPNGERKMTNIWEAACDCERCTHRKQGQPKYVYAVCASNGETFLNSCWFRQCQCEADRLELTIKHEGKCKEPAPPETKLPDNICKGEPKGWDEGRPPY